MIEPERAAKDDQARRDEAEGLAQAELARREERNQRLVTQERLFSAGVLPFYPGASQERE
jgi:hypothetical protein